MEPVLAILQARMSSTRLPGKVLLKINNIPMLKIQILRILQSKRISKLIVATSNKPEDSKIVSLCEELGVESITGSLNNVFDRFQKVISKHSYSHIVRLTGDCPLFMPQICDEMVDSYFSGIFDYFSNTIEPTFPDGLDIEIFRTTAFSKLKTFNLTMSEKEHVTLGFYSRKNIFKCGNFKSTKDLSAWRWTVDNRDDFNFISWVFSELRGQEYTFKLQDVIDILNKFPEKILINAGYLRNEKLENGV